jgi:hypothetical protein
MEKSGGLKRQVNTAWTGNDRSLTSRSKLSAAGAAALLPFASTCKEPDCNMPLEKRFGVKPNISGYGRRTTQAPVRPSRACQEKLLLKKMEKKNSTASGIAKYRGTKPSRMVDPDNNEAIVDFCPVAMVQFLHPSRPARFHGPCYNPFEGAKRCLVFLSQDWPCCKPIKI